MAARSVKPYRQHRRPGNRAQTRPEEAHGTRVKHAGCVCCGLAGFFREEGGPVVEKHHLTSGGIRIGHMAVVGLCLWHHKGRLIVEGWSHAEHREHLGPSLAEGSDPFTDQYGDNGRLLELQEWLFNRQAGLLASEGV